MRKKKYAFLALLIFSFTLFLSGCGPTNQPPTAKFTTSTNNLEVTFDAYGSSDPDGSVVSYSWDFGDGSTGSSVSVTHNYNSAGSYDVELTVKDSAGAQDTSSKTISVTAPSNPPTASFTASPTSGEAPLEVTFDASSSSDSNGNITSYDWDFGDGSGGSGETTNHTFESSGDYTVELTVTDNDGATDTESAVISVSGSSGGIELLNWELKEDSIGDAKIEGSIKNNTNQTTDCEVTAKFYNSSDTRIGNNSAFVWDLSPGTTATFTIWSTANYDEVDDVDIQAGEAW